jgi:hypothetical protein
MKDRYGQHTYINSSSKRELMILKSAFAEVFVPTSPLGVIICRPPGAPQGFRGLLLKHKIEVQL